MQGRRFRSQEGMATIEFTGMAILLMAIVFGIVEFGSLIQAQAVVTNVTREGGSLASRELKNGSDLMELLEASTWPLNFSCPPGDRTCNPTVQERKFKIFVAKVNAGTSDRPDPTCAVEESGSLVGIGVVSPEADPNGRCDLTPPLWDLLHYQDPFNTSLLSQLTVVKVYFRHDPVTPLAELLNVGPVFRGGSIYNFDSSGVIPDPPELVHYDSFLIRSKAVF